MKKSSDPRHQKRIKYLQEIFSYGFQTKDKTNDYSQKALEIKNHLSEIDPLIQKAAPQFPLEKIAKIDVAILRLSIYELAIEKNEPPKVVIDEAIELAKEYGTETSSGFINGVLGTLYKQIYGEKSSKN